MWCSISGKNHWSFLDMIMMMMMTNFHLQKTKTKNFLWNYFETFDCVTLIDRLIDWEVQLIERKLKKLKYRLNWLIKRLNDNDFDWQISIIISAIIIIIIIIIISQSNNDIVLEQFSALCLTSFLFSKGKTDHHLWHPLIICKILEQTKRNKNWIELNFNL